MSVTEREQMIDILGKVFEEFRELLKNGKLKAFSITEVKFKGILKNVLGNVESESYDTYLSNLGETELTSFYNKVKKLVTLLSARTPMKAENLMYGTILQSLPRI